MADSEQVTKCDKPCTKTYCTWGDWTGFSECTSSCGPAQKSRRRYLESSTEEKPIPPAKDSIATSVKYEELESHIRSLDSSRWQDLSAAFASGGIAFLVLLSAMRVVSSVRSEETHHYSSLVDVSPSDLSCTTCAPPDRESTSVRHVTIPGAEPSMPTTCGLDCGAAGRRIAEEGQANCLPARASTYLHHEDSALMPLVAREETIFDRRPEESALSHVAGFIDVQLDWGIEERGMDM